MLTKPAHSKLFVGGLRFQSVEGFSVSCRGAVKIRAEIIILTITISRNVQQKKWNVSSWE